MQDFRELELLVPCTVSVLILPNLLCSNMPVAQIGVQRADVLQM